MNMKGQTQRQEKDLKEQWICCASVSTSHRMSKYPISPFARLPAITDVDVGWLEIWPISTEAIQRLSVYVQVLPLHVAKATLCFRAMDDFDSMVRTGDPFPISIF